MNKRIIHILLPFLVLCIFLIHPPGFIPVYANPVITLTAFIYLVWSLFYKSDVVQTDTRSHSEVFILLCVFVAGACALIVYCIQLFVESPINVNHSDIYPLIQDVYCKRWLNNEFVYAELEGYNYGVWTPNYLPFHWMPILISYFMSIDPRWVPIMIWLFSIAIYIYQLSIQETSLPEKIIKSILPFILLAAICHYQSSAIADTVELMICGYYMLLTLGLTYKMPLSTSLGWLTTLLSRYASAFYLPIDLISSIRERNSQSLINYILVFFGFVLFYGVPFLLLDPSVFFKGAAAYDTAALGEWRGQSWQPPGDLPFQLYRGFGVAAFFFHYLQGPLEFRIEALKYSLFGVAIINMVIWLVISVSKGLHELFRPVALASTIFLFFTFTLVPYSYLYWNVVFVLLVVVSRVRWFSPGAKIST